MANPIHISLAVFPALLGGEQQLWIQMLHFTWAEPNAQFTSV